MKRADRTVVLDTKNLVLAAFDPLEGMFVPSKSPAQVARLPYLVGSTIAFRDVSEFPLGQSRRLVQTSRVGNVTPQTRWFGTESKLPSESEFHGFALS